MRSFLADIATFIPTKPYIKYGHNLIDKFRNFLYRKAFKVAGQSFFIRSFVVFYRPENFSIGHNSLVGTQSKIYCHAEVTIGNDVLVGPELILYTSTHNFKNKNTLVREQGYTTAPVFIEDDVYIGARVTVLPGVKIAKGAVIGASAVVTGDIPEYAIAVGVPAKVIGYRN